MKKQLLALALCMLTTFSFSADFTQTSDNTGLTYQADNGTGAGFAWSFWGPDCSGGENGGGGFEEAGTNVLDFGWGQGGKGKFYIIMTLTTPLDLSDAADQKLSVVLKNLDAPTGSALPLTYELHLEDANNVALITPIDVAVTGTNKTFNIDFSSQVIDNQNMGAVKKIILIYDSCPNGTAVAASHLFMSNLNVGSTVVTTGVNEAKNLIANSTIYPNPASEEVTVKLDLKNSSAVKIVISDLAGREQKVLVNGNLSSVEKNVNVADLQKGMYAVTYYINGAVGKSEKLVIR